MERFINILIIDHDPKIRLGLKEILAGGGNNVLTAETMDTALSILEKKEIGIILVNVDRSNEAFDKIDILKERNLFKNNYIIVITNATHPGSKVVKAINHGAVDFLTYPFNPNLVKSKVEVYKSLFYKDQRIGQLLTNIFPENILDELATSGKFSPKRVQNGVVLFTDFVDFSMKAKKSKPLQLIRKLERYFTEFDRITQKYNLEKIKTIGDAYMALAGVTEDEPNPAIRACLAAIEIRDFMRTERDIAIATKKDFWEIRLGLHMGPLVAGIIGSSKYSFDVWGDTVNIAARAEQASKSGNITISSSIKEKLGNYFDCSDRGQISIHKRGGSLEMYYLHRITPEYSLHTEGRTPNNELREICGLSNLDFDHVRNSILNRMKALLPEDISYHDLPHTLNVEKAAMRYAALEGIKGEDEKLLQTAVLFHDSGFIIQYEHNEDHGAEIARTILPEFGYTKIQIETICSIINATKFDVEPKTLLEKIMCDADHDYLGRPDYHSIAKKLRLEIELFTGKTFSEEEWIQFQLEFLENKHRYYTETAYNIRQTGKVKRIHDLKNQLEKFQNTNNESIH